MSIQVFISHNQALEPYVSWYLAQLRPNIAEVVKREYNNLSPEGHSFEQRRSLAQQKDIQADPSLRPMRDWHGVKRARNEELRLEIAKLKSKLHKKLIDDAEAKRVAMNLGQWPCFAAGQQEGNPAAASYVPKLIAQDKNILHLIAFVGADPRRLAPTRGKAGVKARVRELALADKKLFQSRRVFNKAWERLRKNGEIDDE